MEVLVFFCQFLKDCCFLFMVLLFYYFLTSAEACESLRGLLGHIFILLQLITYAFRTQSNLICVPRDNAT